MPPDTGTKTAYIKRIDELERSIGRLQDTAVRRAVQLLNEAKRKINARVLTESGWRLNNLQSLQSQVDGIMNTFENEYGAILTDITSEVYELGVQAVDDPLGVSGVSLAPATLSRNVVEVLQGLSADLITDLKDEALTSINATIAQSLLGLESPFEAQRRIAGVVGARDSLRDLTGVSARAEKIFRTEVGRIQSVATQARQSQIATQVDDLEKVWAAVGDRKNRTGHLAAHGQSVPVNGFFRVASVRGGPEENLRFPRDPRGSAGNTINCRCRSTSWRGGFGKFLPRNTAQVEKEEERRARRR